MKTALHCAAARDDRNEILKLLLSVKGVDVDVCRPGDNLTPLHYACSNRATKNVETLLSYNASTKSKDSDGNTPKQLATERGAPDELIQLLEDGEKVRFLFEKIVVLTR